MEYCLVDRLDDGIQHKSGALSGSIKSKHTDFPRKHQKLRTDLNPSTYSRLSFYEEPVPIKANQSDDLFGIPSRTDNDESRLDTFTKEMTSFDLALESLPQPEKHEYLSQRLDTLQSPIQTKYPPPSTVLVSPDLDIHMQSPQISASMDRLPKSHSVMDEPRRVVRLVPPGPGPGPPNRFLHLPSTPIVESPLENHREHKNFEFTREWQKIQRLRESTWGQRSKIQEVRLVLREKQYAKSSADDKFLKFVRMQTLGSAPDSQNLLKRQKAIEELARVCEKAREDYGPLEDDCNWLEDQLGRDEFELTKLEERLFSQMKTPENFKLEEMLSEPDSPAASAYSDSDVGQDPHHPLVSKFLSKLGDVGILEERLTYHIEEKHALEGEKESRQLVGHELAPEDQETLDNFEDAFTKLTRQIEEVQKQVEMMKQECLREGLVDQNGNPTDFEKLEQQTFMDDVDAGIEKSEFVKFPALIPRPGIQEVKFYDSGPRPEEISNSAGDHINQWLLHQLRSSPLLVSMLVRIFEAKFGRIEDEHWQIDVVTFWYVDGARKGASKYRIYSSGIATQALLNSDTRSREGSMSDTTEHLSDVLITHSPSEPEFTPKFASLSLNEREGVPIANKHVIRRPSELNTGIV